MAIVGRRESNTWRLTLHDAPGNDVCEPDSVTILDG